MATNKTGRRIPRADSFGKRLTYIRVELGLTQEQAAELCDVRKPTWTYWEAHPDRSPRDLLNVVTRISEALGIDRDWLLWGTSENQQAC